MAEDPSLERYKLEQVKKTGSGWFLWVAGLSIVNTVMTMSGSTFNFILGLGLTQFIDGFVARASPGVKVFGFLLDLLFAGAFLGIWQLSKKYTWAFITGMVVYAGDALIFLFVQEWIGLAFHAFALVAMLAGLKAAMKLADTPEVRPAPVAPSTAGIIG
jgi:hypothetical protein